MHIYTIQTLPAFPVSSCEADVAFCAVTTLIAVLVVGVVLPAIWSEKATRRAAARTVLETLVRLVEAFRRS